MTDPAIGFDVPVEPVWYEAPAVEEPAVEEPAVEPAPASAPVAVAAGPVEHAPAVAVPPDAPVSRTENILPLLEPAAVVEAPVEETPSAAQEERRPPRQWRTLPVVAALIVALLVGFVIGRVTDSSGGASSSNGSATGSSAKGQPSATAAGAAPPEASGNAPAPAPTSGAPGQINGNTVLLNIPRHTGPLITDHFTVAANRWVLGWAYDCTAQGGTGSFNITVFDGSGGPSKDGGIDQQGAKGSSVVAYTSTGERYLSVTTNCVWAIRVTT